MSQIISIILVLNLCFAGGTIFVILHGMYISKKTRSLDMDSIHNLEKRKISEGPKSQF
ncbi:hypothetical protein GQ41_0009 [Arenibacter algicola]|jgi:hypothetical protein|uniref:Uncharacterized protein n=1 Tax=Arenibacter algicola TaxID=616991 RepID=A0ABY3A4E1_9FLAO|nr:MULTISPECIES: hypothetical protein [Arenibacter]MDX1759608.1 hypothetical protein [Arenibacter algicola]GBF20549.1 hypothetical protein C21_02722 [Arenibacter sp. NBRC 103722]